MDVQAAGGVERGGQCLLIGQKAMCLGHAHWGVGREKEGCDASVFRGLNS